MKLSRRVQTRGLLAINALIAIVLIGWVLTSFRSDFVESPTEPLSELAPISRQSVPIDAIVEHPLFSPERKQATPPAQASVVEAAVPQSPPLLVGVLKGESNQIGGLLEDPQSGTRKFVRVGETFVDWTLVSVRPKSAFVRSGTQEIELRFPFDLEGSGETGSSAPDQSTPKNP